MIFRTAKTIEGKTHVTYYETIEEVDREKIVRGERDLPRSTDTYKIQRMVNNVPYTRTFPGLIREKFLERSYEVLIWPMRSQRFTNIRSNSGKIDECCMALSSYLFLVILNAPTSDTQLEAPWHVLVDKDETRYLKMFAKFQSH